MYRTSKKAMSLNVPPGTFPLQTSSKSDPYLYAKSSHIHLESTGLGWQLQNTSGRHFREQIKTSINNPQIAQMHEQQKAAQPITHNRLVNRPP